MVPIKIWIFVYKNDTRTEKTHTTFFDARCLLLFFFRFFYFLRVFFFVPSFQLVMCVVCWIGFGFLFYRCCVSSSLVDWWQTLYECIGAFGVCPFVKTAHFCMWLHCFFFLLVFRLLILFLVNKRKYEIKWYECAFDSFFFNCMRVCIQFSFFADWVSVVNVLLNINSIV